MFFLERFSTNSTFVCKESALVTFNFLHFLTILQPTFFRGHAQHVVTLTYFSYVACLLPTEKLLSGATKKNVQSKTNPAIMQTASKPR